MKKNMIIGAAVVALNFSTQAAPVTVPNPSFESPDQSGATLTSVVPTGWTTDVIGSPGSPEFSGAGMDTISPIHYNNGVPDTNSPPSSTNNHQVVYLNGICALYTDVGALQPNTAYTLKVSVGLGSDGQYPNFPGAIGLVNGTTDTGTPLVTKVVSSGFSVTNYVDYTATFATGGSVSGDLTIVLQSTITNLTGRVAFDDVRLDASSPGITSQPVSEALYAGRTARFTVGAAGAGTLHYQWQTNGVNTADGGNLSGSTTATLTITNVSAANVGSYRVVVSNASGAITSSVATFQLVTPSSTSTLTYENAVLQANPVAYWPLNETGDPTTGTLLAYDTWAGFNGLYGIAVTNDVPGPEPGGYSVFASTDTAALFTSNTANCYITVPALNLNTNTVTIACWVNATQTYQSTDAGLFVCRSSDTAAGLELYNTWSVGCLWSNQLEALGGNSSLGVFSNTWTFIVLTVTPSNSIAYVWNTNSQAAAAAVATNLVQAFDANSLIGSDPLSPLTQTWNGPIAQVAVFNYAMTQAQVQKLYSGATFNPTITSQPVSESVYAGLNRSASLTVVASSSEPLNYQWRLNVLTNGVTNSVNLTNSGNLYGTATATLTISNVTAANAGSYQVVVSNSLGVTTSAVATIGLVSPWSADTATYENAVLEANPVAYWQLNETGSVTNAIPLVANDYWGGFSGTYGAGLINGVAGPEPADGFSIFPSTNYAVQLVQGVGNSIVSVPPLNLHTNAATIACWVYPLGSQNNYCGLFFCRDSGTTAGLSYNASGTLAFSWSGSATTYNWNSGLTPPANQWSFVVLTVTPTTGTIYLYNTASQTSKTLTGLANPVQAFISTEYIGSDTYQPPNRTFNGEIGQVAIFNRTLTTAQVNELYSGASFLPTINTALAPDEIKYAGGTVLLSATVSGYGQLSYQWQRDGSTVASGTGTSPALTLTDVTPPSDGSYTLVLSNSFGMVTSGVETVTVESPVPGSFANAVVTNAPYAYWRFNETSGTVAYDSWGPFDGAYGSAATMGVAGPQAPAFPGFESNNTAVKTVGGTSQSWVEAPALNVDTNAVTVMGWVYPNPGVSQAPNAGLCFSSAVSQSPWGLIYDTTGTNLAYEWNGTVWNSSGLVLPSGQWSFVALVISPTQGLLYLGTNGATLAFAANFAPQSSATSDGPFYIGSDGTAADNFDGMIDEVAVFQHSLTVDQINDLYGAGLGAVETTAATIVQQPASLELYAGRTARLAVGVIGSSPLHYQWQSNNVNLSDVGNRSGSATATLTISNLVAANAGSYQLVVTNAQGAVTSIVATLTVVEPTGAAYEGAVMAADPVAYWRLNETGDTSSGTLPAYDYWGGYTGVYGTAVTDDAPGPQSPAFLGFETTNSAALISALPDCYVTVPPLYLNTNTVTFTCWMNPSVATEPAYAGVIYCRDGQTISGLNFNSSSHLGYTWNNTSSTYGWNSGITPPANQWSFVALVVSPSNAVLYVDNASGPQIATNAVSNVIQNFGAGTLIGADPFNDPARSFEGTLDEVAIFNYALAPAQVQELYQAALYGSTNALLIITEPQGATLYYTNNPSVPLGYPYTFTPAIVGPGTLTYQWYLNGHAISGATNATYTVTNLQFSSAGTYSLHVGNGVVSTNSTAAVLQLAPFSPGLAFGNRQNWEENGTGLFITPDVLQLTDGAINEAGSAFYLTPQPINGFLASFTYQDVGATLAASTANGATFCLQTQGPTALGDDGANLGEETIAPAVELQMNIYATTGQGLGFGSDGATGTYAGVEPVNFASGDPIDVALLYSQGQAQVTLVDTVTGDAFETNIVTGDITQILGTNTAYVGFTGSDGSVTSVQQISNFAFEGTSTASLYVTSVQSGTMTLVWPGVANPAFILQQSPTVTGPWTTATNMVNVTNGQYQVSVTPSGQAEFFRLALP